MSSPPSSLADVDPNAAPQLSDSVTSETTTPIDASAEKPSPVNSGEPRRPKRQETLPGYAPATTRPVLYPGTYNYREAGGTGLEQIDFEEKYPQGSEDQKLDEHRLFKVYNELMARREVELVVEGKESTDVQLVFAALFSAVLTTFVAQTSQSLQTDNAALTVSLLSELVSLQRVAEGNGTLSDVEQTSLSTLPSSFDIWVNGLWFTSLTLSLSATLFAVLVKQWLHQYTVLHARTTRERSLIHQFRFAGLQRWRVMTIIGVLPIIMHVSLALFLAGMVVFLIPLHLPIACVVGVITVVIYGLYIVTNILPISDIQCPYRTPTSAIFFQLLYRPYTGILAALRGHIDVVRDLASSLQDMEWRTVAKPTRSGDLTKGIFKDLTLPEFHRSVHSIAIQAVGAMKFSEVDRDDLQINHDIVYTHVTGIVQEIMAKMAPGDRSPRLDRLVYGLEYTHKTAIYRAAADNLSDGFLLTLISNAAGPRHCSSWDGLLDHILSPTNAGPKPVSLAPAAWRILFANVTPLSRGLPTRLPLLIERLLVTPNASDVWNDTQKWTSTSASVSLSCALRNLPSNTHTLEGLYAYVPTSNRAVYNFAIMYTRILDHLCVDHCILEGEQHGHFLAVLAAGVQGLGDRDDLQLIWKWLGPKFFHGRRRRDNCAGASFLNPSWDSKILLAYFRTAVQVLKWHASSQWTFRSNDVPELMLANVDSVILDKLITEQLWSMSPEELNESRNSVTVRYILGLAFRLRVPSAVEYFVQKDLLSNPTWWWRADNEKFEDAVYSWMAHACFHSMKSSPKCLEYMFQSSGNLVALMKYIRPHMATERGWVDWLIDLRPTSPHWDTCKERLAATDVVLVREMSRALNRRTRLVSVLPMPLPSESPLHSNPESERSSMLTVETEPTSAPDAQDIPGSSEPPPQKELSQDDNAKERIGSEPRMLVPMIVVTQYEHDELARVDPEQAVSDNLTSIKTNPDAEQSLEDGIRRRLSDDVPV